MNGKNIGRSILPIPDVGLTTYDAKDPYTNHESATVPQEKQAEPAGAATLLSPQKAFSRIEEDQADELRAYVLGVQAVVWGMQ